MRKKLAVLTMCAALAAGSLYGCAPEDGTSASAAAPANIEARAESEKEETTAAASNTEVNEELKGDLVFAIWDNNLMDYIDQNDMAGKFQETYPNVNIEVEKIKDDSEYWNAMKMRASANQLPDVMFNKPFTLSRFKDYLIDLSGLDATKNNELAAGYALDGKILGIPMTAGYEYVYYWKDMFEEAGVEVPTTWDQLKEVSKTIQDYYGKDNPDFMAIALGAKDEWPDYPFMEFMPALEGGNGQNWNDMAKTDAPFAADTDIAKAYQKVYDLFTSGVFGKDPLGLGSDQATALFAQKQAAITALGAWGLQNIQNGTDDYSQLGTFYLPARNTESGPFRVIVQGDSFMGITTHSKNPEAAKAFVEWFYSDAWYPGYINFVTSASSMTNFPKEKDPILAEADAAQPDMELVMYDGGGDDFQAIQNETAFDYKKLGAEMFTKGFDLTARLDELNTKWAAARQKLGIR
ncbi:carbohydrate ABC transporter substrate-binding protein [Enterocloster clostridioformis]|uniref:ABC transporter substrate-binding protein n=1 Tax=Enterocloster clostridioformis TaxID=1531 RepID=UPI00080C4260|nr:extracellular solute-binding protein [Enterocloster clostridioformis]ANU49265.1 sugar ABC transporter substrate-binding protein [Lachnoclostridium sp. YL32]NDO31901.1 carbohydrate ABC transporter substrate-binding protein [Enterocloster clostridioformis]OXE64396.1 carbohydrate ABC transporter substrate-binding protein [Enterocloster clostridioformis]QQR01807.1 extracellular solute-binding protein [Enterocloster clostridioformis]